jgi:hypothetical protein
MPTAARRNTNPVGFSRMMNAILDGRPFAEAVTTGYETDLFRWHARKPSLAHAVRDLMKRAGFRQSFRPDQGPEAVDEHFFGAAKNDRTEPGAPGLPNHA